MRPVRLAILVAALVLMASPALAQDAGGGAGGPGPQAQPLVRDVHGEINSIDYEKQTLNVGGGFFGGGETLHVTGQTRFISGPGVKPGLKLADLKEGDRVRASYRRVDDKNEALEIVVLTPSVGESPQASPSGGQPGSSAPPQ